MEFKKVRVIILTFLLFLALVCAYNLYKVEAALNTYLVLVNSNPVVITEPKEPKKELIFLAHGFAGSTSFMKPIAVSLARSGYKTVRFDFLGHGRHSKPYTGNILKSSGATQILANQTQEIVEYFLRKNDHIKGIIIGHSMASDIIFRVAAGNKKLIGAIGISSYTDEIKPNKPYNTLILNGEWEPRLRAKALENLTSLGFSEPKEGTIYGNFEDGTARKVESITKADHVRILYSKFTQNEVNDWINLVTGSKIDTKENKIGFLSLSLFMVIILAFIISVTYLPKRSLKKVNVKLVKCAIGNFIAIVTVPFLLNMYQISFVPYPAQNYLINHFLLYSLVLGFFLPLRSLKAVFMDFNLGILVFLLFFYNIIIGGVLDRYVSSFFPHNVRIDLLIILFIVCFPLMTVIQIFSNAEKNSFFMSNLTRISILISLSSIIFLNFSEYFLVAYAILLMICFFIVFNSLSSLLFHRFKSFLSVSLANGFTLAWTLSSALPLYVL